MVPASSVLAQTAAAPRPRFVGVFFPHGMAPGYWVPGQEGSLPEKLPYIVESLERLREHTVILSGLWSKSAEPPEGTTGSDHWVAAAYLTGIKPRKTAGSDATVGSPTIDQNIARHIGQDTLLPSLQLALEDRVADAAGRDSTHQPPADGAQPAGGVRASVRQRLHAGDAGRADAAEPQHPRFGPRPARRNHEESWRRRPPDAQPVHGRDSRDRAAGSD